MPKVTAAVAALLLLALTGCASEPETAPSGPQEPAVTVAEETPAPVVSDSPSAAPLVVEPQAKPTNPEHWGNYTAEEFYLAGLKDTWRWGEPPTAEQWLAAGYYACEQIAAGTPKDQIVAVEGEGDDMAWNNRAVIAMATDSLCYEG